MVPDETGAFAPLAGGAVFNTAIGLGRQGAPVGLLSGVSTDLFGAKLADELSNSNVSTDHLIRSDRPTTLAFVTLENGQAKYAFYDENTAGRLLDISDIPKTLPSEINALFFGGISLAVEPCADTYLEILKRYGADRLVMVDPNIRTGFILDEARYRERLEEILGHADVVKVSDEDLDWIDRRSVARAEKVKKLHDLGVTLVCMTMGADGVELYSAKGLIAQAQTPKMQVVDTVGAGDAFNAGFLTILHRHNALRKRDLGNVSETVITEAIEFATRFAADTVTRKGSDPGWKFV